MLKEQIIEIQKNPEECIKLYSSGDRQMGVKGGLNHKKR